MEEMTKPNLRGLNQTFFAKHLRGKKKKKKKFLVQNLALRFIVQRRKMPRSEGPGGGEAGTGSTKGISSSLLAQLRLSSDRTTAVSHLWQTDFQGCATRLVTREIHFGDVLGVLSAPTAPGGMEAQ